MFKTMNYKVLGNSTSLLFHIFGKLRQTSAYTQKFEVSLGNTQRGKAQDS